MVREEKDIYSELSWLELGSFDRIANSYAQRSFGEWPFEYLTEAR